MKKILVYAYQLSPTQGSEAGLAWDYIMNMSRNNKLVVLYGSSNEYHQLGNTELMEKYIKSNPIENVTLVPVKPSFNFVEQNYSIIGIARFYQQYNRYQKDVYSVAEKLCETEKFDLVHFLGPIGYREPGLLWKLGLPYMWGPIGGMVFTDLRLLQGADDLKGGLQLFVKKVVNEIQMYTSYSVRKAMRSADLVLGCTKKTTSIIRKIFNVQDDHLSYLPQNCIKEIYPINYNKYYDYDYIHLIWIGRIDFGKSLITTLKALAKSKNKAKYKLHVIGEGHLYGACKKYIEKHTLSDIVEFHGKISREEVFNLLNCVHLHITTSLLDVNPTVMWEAMSLGVPTISVANNGVDDIVHAGTGFLIPLSNYNRIIANIADTLDAIADNPSIIVSKVKNIEQERLKYGWSVRSKQFEELYEITISNFNKKDKSK